MVNGRPLRGHRLAHGFSLLWAPGMGAGAAGGRPLFLFIFHNHVKVMADIGDGLVAG